MLKTSLFFRALPAARCYVSVVLLDDTIYAMGGFDGHHRLNTVEKYNFDRNQWTMVAPMVSQRSDACAAVLNSERKPLIFVRDLFAVRHELQTHAATGRGGLEYTGPPYVPRGPREGPLPKFKTKAIFPPHRAAWGVQGLWGSHDPGTSKGKTI